jgi:hypothetical protein
MHEHHIGVAAPAGVERLTGALRQDLHVDSRFRLEQRQDVAEQAGILRRCGGRHHDGLVLRQCGGGQTSQKGGGYQECAACVHFSFLSCF